MWTEPCAWSLLPVLSYVWVYSDLQAGAGTDRLNFYQIQLSPVMWAAIKVIWFEEENYWTEKNIYWKYGYCQLGSCEPRNRSWEPETFLKNCTWCLWSTVGYLETTYILRYHYTWIQEWQLIIWKNGNSLEKQNWLKRKENFIHLWTFTDKKIDMKRIYWLFKVLMP